MENDIKNGVIAISTQSDARSNPQLFLDYCAALAATIQALI
jgi:hypothetical protein